MVDIQQSVSSVTKTYSWQEPVLTRTATPPGSPAVDARYLIIATASGAWVGKENDIAEWSGATWKFYTPEDDWVVIPEDEDIEYIYTGAAWVTAASVVGNVLDSDFNANTILAATLNNTPLPRTIAAQQLVGRITAGEIKGLTVAEARTLLSITNVTDDAQLKRAAADLGSFAAKTALVRPDILIIEDSEDSDNKKSVTLESLEESMIPFETLIGSIVEITMVTVTESVGVVSLNLEKDGGGDLTLLLADGFHDLDTTPAVSVALSLGTDTVPVLNYVYIPQSTKVLTKSTVGWPSEPFCPIATVLVQSAALVATDGVYKLHAWVDHSRVMTENGHISHINKWIRSRNANWVSGVSPSYSGSGTATVGVSTAVGVIFQLHDHAFPVFADPADLYVFNDSVTAYDKITNLAALTLDSAGASLSNKTFGLVLWGVQSQNSSDCKLYINLPSSSINGNKVDDARHDEDKFVNFSIPIDFRGTGFLIARIICFRSAGGNVTVDVDPSDDLRGQFPNTTAGGSSGFGRDPAAIHVDVAAEISAITEKTSVVDADLVVIEDSEDSNNKKKIQVDTLTDAWRTVSTSDYTATPDLTSRLLMSDTSKMIVRGQLEYTIGGTLYYGSVAAISANVHVDIIGAPLGGDVTLLRQAQGRLIQWDEIVAGTFGDGVDATLLVTDMKRARRWSGPDAACVGFAAWERTVDTGAESKVNMRIAGNAVSTNDTNKGVQLGAAETWIDNSAIAINTANYLATDGDALDIACEEGGGTGDARDLSFSAWFVRI